MTLWDTLLSELSACASVIGFGFLFRLGMCGVDSLLELLTEHFRKKEP